MAIVGAGFSGAALAIELASSAAVRVTVIDRNGGFGRGLAYSTSDPDHLLNVHAERMSALPDAPLDFVRWLREKQLAEEAHTQYAPRALYGAYLAERMSITAGFAKEGALRLVTAKATRLRASDTAVRIDLDQGDAIEADVAVLSIGNLPPAAPFDVASLSQRLYKHDPWDASALADIPHEGDVLLVGAGLTMIDVALTLSRAPRQGRLFALSRRGLLPQPQSEAPFAPAVVDPAEVPEQLSEALRELRRRARAAAARGEPWQHIMNALRPHTQTLWRRMPLATQRRFLRHARPWWDTHRHRAAPHAVEAVEALRRSGRLHILQGRVVAVDATGEHATVSYRPRGQASVETLRVAAVVNCTGASADLTQTSDALISCLLRDGCARPHPNGLGFDVDEYGALIAADGSVSRRVFALGPPTQGAFWEITAVQEIRRAAESMARRLTAV